MLKKKNGFRFSESHFFHLLCYLILTGRTDDMTMTVLSVRPLKKSYIYRVPSEGIPQINR